MNVLLDEFITTLKVYVEQEKYWDREKGQYVGGIIEKEVKGVFMPIGRKRLQSDTTGFYATKDMIFYSNEIFKEGTIMEDIKGNEKYKIIESKDYGYINQHYKEMVLRKLGDTV